mmetsp:Transcript_32701/g.28969  ORF Transcript_32701/g.28969 Transcript_32701/m.28969 type:complete len:103 (+) Transcript_32701:2-310(+)
MAPRKKPIVVDLNKDKKLYEYTTFIQIFGLLSFFLFYADFSIYIAIKYFEADDYYWFSFQTAFYFNFIILLIWMAISLIVFLILSLATLACSSSEGEAARFI